MVTLRPKEIFQKSQNDREKWHATVTDPLFQRAVTTALAEMSLACFGERENYGANAFVMRLLNLSEVEEAARPLPVKHLTSYDPQIPATSTTPPKK